MAGSDFSDSDTGAALEFPPDEDSSGPQGTPMSILMPANKELLAACRKLAGDKDVRVVDLAAAVAQDPVVALELLRIANSVVLRQDRPPVTTVETAVVQLGSVQVLECLDKISQRNPIRDSSVEETFEGLLNLSKRVSLISRMISMSKRPDLVDEAETIGLLSHIGDLMACFYFGNDYVTLAASRTRPALIYRLSQEYDFNMRTFQASYLRRNGLPEVLLFALDMDSVSKTPQRTALRYIANSATEVVYAYENKRFEKYSTYDTLPSNSSLRLLQISEKQYEPLFDAFSEFFAAHEQAEEENKQAISGEALKTSSAKLQTIRSDIESKLAEGSSAEIEVREEGESSDSRVLNKLSELDIASELPPPHPTATSLGVPAVDEEIDDSPSMQFPAAPEPSYESSKVYDAQDPPDYFRYNENALYMLDSLARLCDQAEDAGDLLAKLMNFLVDDTPFERACLFSVEANNRRARILCSSGDNLEPGAQISINDPLSPLRTCFTKLQSFNAIESKDVISPLGVSSYAVTPLAVTAPTLVALYADCGTAGSMTFETRRIFRYMAALLNSTLPHLPGGLPEI